MEQVIASLSKSKCQFVIQSLFIPSMTLIHPIEITSTTQPILNQGSTMIVFKNEIYSNRMLTIYNVANKITLNIDLSDKLSTISKMIYGSFCGKILTNNRYYSVDDIIDIIVKNNLKKIQFLFSGDITIILDKYFQIFFKKLIEYLLIHSIEYLMLLKTNYSNDVQIRNICNFLSGFDNVPKIYFT